MPTVFTGVSTSRAGVSGGTFPPDEISNIVMGWNPRFEINQEKIRELADSIARNPLGQREPVHVKKGKDGRPVLLAGQRRKLAITLINDNLVEYMARYPHIQGPFGLKYLCFDGLDEKAAIRHSLSENVDRESLTPIDQAKTILSLRNMGWEDSEIAESLRVKPSQLSTLLGYLEMPPDAQEALHDGVITQQLAKEMRDLPDEEITKTVKKVKRGKLTPSQAVRETKSKKRKSGQKVPLTYKEFFDELALLVDDMSLAFDLDAYRAGESTYSSLQEILVIYNLEPEEEESGEAILPHVKIRNRKGGR